MSRFRLIVAALAVSVGLAISGLWSRLPPLPPEPPHRIVRGPQSIDPKYEEWLMAVKARQAMIASSATAVTFDSETVAWVAGVLTIFSLLITGLAKYVITPMILKQLALSLDELDKKFCTRQDLIVALMAIDENNKAMLQLSQIWKAENR